MNPQQLFDEWYDLVVEQRGANPERVLKLCNEYNFARSEHAVDEDGNTVLTLTTVGYTYSGYVRLL